MILTLLFALPGLTATAGPMDPYAEAREVGGEALVRLVQYRENVERDAYAETMQLCANYPLADGEFPGDRPPGLPWLKIAGEGAWQPLSLFGVNSLKSSYNQFNRVRIWQFDAWFRSVHTIYLVNSPGFRRAAEQCLGTTNEAVVRRFAFAVTGVDILGTMISGEVLAVPMGFALGLAAERGAALWSKVIPPRLARKLGQLALATVVPVASANLLVYLNNLRHARAAAESIIANSVDEHDRLVETSRRILMARAVTELRRALRGNQTASFEIWVRDHVSAEDLARAHEDQAALVSKGRLSEDDQRYQTVLNAILPVLDQINLVSAAELSGT